MDAMDPTTILLTLHLATVLPAAVVLRKAGRSPWWAALLVPPGVNLVVIWVFAFVRWPAVDDGSDGGDPRGKDPMRTPFDHLWEK